MYSIAPDQNSDEKNPRYSAAWWRPRIKHATMESERFERPANARYREGIGPYYREGWPGASEVHGNWYIKFVLDMMPTLCSGELASAVGSIDPDQTGSHAEALEVWLNQTIKEQDITGELEQVCDPMLWGPGGVLMVYPEDVPGTTSERMASMGVQAPMLRCRVKAIDRNLCFVDPDHEISEGEYQGHREVVSFADILEEAAGSPDSAGWNVDLVQKAMAQDDTSGDLKEVRKKTFGDGVCSTTFKPDEMVVYRVWCRRTQMIHTLAYRQQENESEGFELRKPVQWRGHPRGPYVWFGLLWVRGNAYPLSPTALAERMVRRQDKHLKKADDDAMAAKRNVAMKGKNALKAFAKLKNGEGWNVDSSTLKDIETGGVQQATAEYIAYLDADIVELFGLSPARMGDTAQGPATNTVVAEQALNGKKRLFVNRWKACVREALKRMAFIGWNLDQVETSVPMPNPDTGEMESARYYGGVMEGDQADWMSVENQIDLEPFSLGGADAAAMQETLDKVAAIVDQVIARIAANPLAAKMGKWENWLDDRMKAAGIAGGAKRYVNWAFIRAYVGAMGTQAVAMAAAGAGTQVGPMPVARGGGGGGGNALTAARSIGSSAGGAAQTLAGAQ